MKAAILALLSAVLVTDVIAVDLEKAVEDGDQTPLFEWMGYSDLDIVQGVEGVVSGLSKKDVREKYDTCYMGIPTMAVQLKSEVMSIDFGQIMSWSKDWAEM